ncbi:MAG: hypothetical protein V1702_06405 [Candidatus Woesearchaeota archaeon]
MGQGEIMYFEQKGNTVEVEVPYDIPPMTVFERRDLCGILCDGELSDDQKSRLKGKLEALYALGATRVDGVVKMTLADSQTSLKELIFKPYGTGWIALYLCSLQQTATKPWKTHPEGPFRVEEGSVYAAKIREAKEETPKN